MGNRLQSTANGAEKGLAAGFLEQCAVGIAKRRCFKKGVIATLGYCIAHESHHRGNILLTLKECGHKLDQKTQYALWDWDKM